MRLEEMPNCLCGNIQAWQPGGGSIGGSGSTSWFHCQYCGRAAVEIYFGTGVLLTTSEVRKFNDESDMAYVNGPLMTALRFRQMRVDEARRVIEIRYWDKACDAVGVPRGTMIDAVPEDKRALFRHVYGRDRNDADYEVPPGMGGPFIPPQLPDDLVAFTRLRHRRSRWRQVSRQETGDALVPLDPIRIRHDEHWAEIFEALRPLADIKPYKLKNGYCGSPHEPWYWFTVNNSVFIVGPRKRVVSLEVAFHKPTNAASIAALAKRDEVTSEWTPLGGYIHAWNKFRLVEYMTALIGIAKNIEKPAAA